MEYLLFEAGKKPTRVSKSRNVFNEKTFSTDRETTCFVNIVKKPVVDSEDDVEKLFDVKKNPAGMFYMFEKDSTELSIASSIIIGSMSLSSMASKAARSTHVVMTRKDAEDIVDHVSSSRGILMMDNARSSAIKQIVDGMSAKGDSCLTIYRSFSDFALFGRIEKAIKFVCDSSVEGLEKKVAFAKKSAMKLVSSDGYENEDCKQKADELSDILSESPFIGCIDNELVFCMQYNRIYATGTCKPRDGFSFDGGDIKMGKYEMMCKVILKSFSGTGIDFLMKASDREVKELAIEMISRALSDHEI